MAKTPKREKQQVPASPFDEEVTEALLEVAHWWMAEGKEAARADDVAPKFKQFKSDHTKTISVRLPKTFIGAVEAKIKKEGTKHGGDFSKLTMWLLWRYLGSPSEYVEE